MFSPPLQAISVAPWQFLLFREGSGASVMRKLKRYAKFLVEPGPCTDNTLTVVAPADKGADLCRLLQDDAVHAAWEPPFRKLPEGYPHFKVICSFGPDQPDLKLPLPLQHADAVLPGTLAHARWAAWVLKYQEMRPLHIACVGYLPTLRPLWAWSQDKGYSSPLPRAFPSDLKAEIRALASAYPLPR